jgi:Spherulation-specific family 4
MPSRLLSMLWAAAAALLPLKAVAHEFALLVPAYFYPVGPGAVYWEQLAVAAAKVPVIAILNPASGPGAQVDGNYVAAVNRLRSAGGQVLAYVATGYGKRGLDVVTSEILAYRDQYALDGFFLDEMGNDGSAASVGYYASLYQYIKALAAGYRVVGNPGTTIAETYLSHPTVDSLVVFENNRRYYRNLKTPAWVRNYPAASFSHLVYQVNEAASVFKLLDQARAGNASLIYFTDDHPDNPWDVLPSYWEALVTEVCRRNRKAEC